MAETLTVGGHPITLIRTPALPENVIGLLSVDGLILFDTEGLQLLKLNRQQATAWMRERERQETAEAERLLK